MARTAVVAGTATAVAGGVSRRQQNRWASQDQAQYQQQAQYAQQPAQQAPPPAAAAPAPDPISQLKELADLKAQGVLTEQEFEAQKARILNS
jgi:outer membrane murein-binding lipoprotein Lpp